MSAKRHPIKDSALVPPKPSFDEILESSAKLNQAKIDFLKIDAETALTFTSIALQADNAARRERNRRSARKAYDTLVTLIPEIDLNAQDARILSEKMQRLKSELIRLGETL